MKRYIDAKYTLGWITKRERFALVYSRRLTLWSFGFSIDFDDSAGYNPKWYHWRFDLEIGPFNLIWS